MKLTDSDGDYRCHWEPVGEEYDCSQLWPTTTTTTVAPGCCAGSDYKSSAKCMASTEQDRCENMSNCHWIETEDGSDCMITTTTESGCCAGKTRQSTEKCAEKEGREECERMEKCEFRSGETDCSWPTTTESPWMNAKPEKDGFSPKPNPKDAKKAKEAGKSEALLFGETGVVAEAINTSISLSTVLLLAVAAFAVYKISIWASHRNGGYTKLEEQHHHPSQHQTA